MFQAYSGEIVIAISILTLHLGYKLYKLKHGAELEGQAFTSSLTDGSGGYISYVKLRNRKDRAVAIYCITMRLKRTVTLEVDYFGSKPMVLEPFGECIVRYNEDHRYYVQGTNVFAEISSLLRPKYQGHRIYAITSEGTVRVKKPKHRGIWRGQPILGSPDIIGVMRPGQGETKNFKKYFIVIWEEKKVYFSFLIDTSRGIPDITNFNISEEMLSSADALREGLTELLRLNFPPQKRVEVIDFSCDLSPIDDYCYKRVTYSKLIDDLIDLVKKKSTRKA